MGITSCLVQWQVTSNKSCLRVFRKSSQTTTLLLFSGLVGTNLWQTKMNLSISLIVSHPARSWQTSFSKLSRHILCTTVTRGIQKWPKLGLYTRKQWKDAQQFGTWWMKFWNRLMAWWQIPDGTKCRGIYTNKRRYRLTEQLTCSCESGQHTNTSMQVCLQEM